MGRILRFDSQVLKNVSSMINLLLKLIILGPISDFELP